MQPKLNTELQFINHASVMLRMGDVNLLCDPWFEGDAFNGCWDLLVQPSGELIASLLDDVTHIWISHEHPDHFSIKFFRRYTHLLRKRAVKILFQNTRDERVLNYLKSQSLSCTVLVDRKKHYLSRHVYVQCFKNGFYDSALYVNYLGEGILNLNDCDLRSRLDSRPIFTQTGTVDILLSQFGYAAWKGGLNNDKWRKQAAREKLAALKNQAETFSPRYLIPFASFIYFSNELNAYLNNGQNTPNDVIRVMEGGPFETVILKPGDSLNQNISEPSRSRLAAKYWSEQFNCISSLPLRKFKSVPYDELLVSYEGYIRRIWKSNSKLIMRVLKLISFLGILQPIVFSITDLQRLVEIDIVSGTIRETKTPPDILIHSQPLNFVFLNPFGFDTLTVSGVFEEGRAGGFTRAAKCLAIENLNNIGLSLDLKIIGNAMLVIFFLKRLNKIRRHLTGA